MNEVGTLKELDVKPGDVVYVHDAHNQYIIGENPHKTPGQVKATTGFHYDWRIATIITRVTPSPKLWRDMSDTEKGALLLAKHEGKVIENKGKYNDWIATTPCWDDDYAYRVRPEPKVEVVDVFWKRGETGYNHKIGTMNLIDGKPDTASIKMEAI